MAVAVAVRLRFWSSPSHTLTRTGSPLSLPLIIMPCRCSRSMKCVLLTFVNTRRKCIVWPCIVMPYIHDRSLSLSDYEIHFLDIPLFLPASLFYSCMRACVPLRTFSQRFTGIIIIIDWYNNEMYFHNIKWNSYQYSYCYGLWISFYKRARARDSERERERERRHDRQTETFFGERWEK